MGTSGGLSSDIRLEGSEQTFWCLPTILNWQPGRGGMAAFSLLQQHKLDKQTKKHRGIPSKGSNIKNKQLLQ